MASSIIHTTMKENCKDMEETKYEEYLSEIQRFYFKHEREIDKSYSVDRLGLDNATGNFGIIEIEWKIQDGKLKEAEEWKMRTAIYLYDAVRIVDGPLPSYSKAGCGWRADLYFLLKKAFNEYCRMYCFNPYEIDKAWAQWRDTKA